MSAPLQFARVSKWYGPVLGISEVEFDVDGGVYGLLGMNGAGKSTILKLASGLLSCNLGEVRVFGGDPSRSLAVRRRIGLCPEIDSFYERMSGLQWVRHMAVLAGVARRDAKKRAEELMELVGMQEALHKKIGSYSKGMRQRTKLARALAQDPELLLLDEPMTGLDPVARRDMVELVRRLGSEGRTVLVSSHVLSEVEAMTSRILLIHRGRLLAEGSVSEIREQLDDWPHRVEVRSGRARQIAKELAAYEGVLSLSIDGERVAVETEGVAAFLERVQELAADPSNEVEGVRPLDEGLEAVFRHLVDK
jgi:ABC-2 type transport system ATP-binding protein